MIDMPTLCPGDSETFSSEIVLGLGQTMKGCPMLDDAQLGLLRRSYVAPQAVPGGGLPKMKANPFPSVASIKNFLDRGRALARYDGEVE
jgi:hypothetical protein